MRFRVFPLARPGAKPLCTLGAGLVLTLGLLARSGPPESGWTGRLGGPGRGSEPVLVFVIPERASALRVRAAVRAERIVWQGGAGLALVGGRVIASDLEAAADVIEAADWVERPIEIVRLEARPDPGDGGAGSQAAADRLARLRRLIGKPTLTRGEQVFVLQAISDGLEF